METGEVLEKEVQTTDGNWFQMNIVPYVEHESGRTNGVIITKRVAAMKELEKLNSEHDVLMFALSHDIQQPVSIITLLGDALRLAYEKQDTKQLNNYIRTLKRSAKSMKTLVADFTRKGRVQKKRRKASTLPTSVMMCWWLSERRSGEMRFRWFGS